MRKKLSALLFVAMLVLVPLAAQAAPDSLPKHIWIPKDATFVGMYDESINQTVGFTVAIYKVDRFDGFYMLITDKDSDSYGSLRVYSFRDAVMWVFPASETAEVEASNAFYITAFNAADDMTLAFNIMTLSGSRTLRLIYFPKNQ